MLPTLKSGGKLCVNLSAAPASSGAKRKGTTAKGWQKICDPMNEFLDEFRDSEYQGCIGMEMAKRPNSGGAGTAKSKEYSEESLQFAEETKDKRFCEPVWIWEKK